MRIISDFKDYYDTAQGFGIDPAICYVRKQEFYEYKRHVPWFAPKKTHLPRGLDDILRGPLDILARLPNYFVRLKGRYTRECPEIPVTTRLIGFCGFLYPSIEINEITFNSIEQMKTGLSDAFLKQFSINKAVLEEMLSAKTGPFHDRCISQDAWGKITGEFVDKQFDDVFIKLGIPIFKLEIIASNSKSGRWGIRDDSIRCTLNPQLKSSTFQKIKGPAEAFQEISMYLGNQLARQPDPIAKVSDEIMRDEKGFDEWSFRRHKEDDKKHRKRQQKKP